MNNPPHSPTSYFLLWKKKKLLHNATLKKQIWSNSESAEKCRMGWFVSGDIFRFLCVQTEQLCHRVSQWPFFCVLQVNVRVTTMDSELEFSFHPNTTGKQLFDQVRPISNPSFMAADEVLLMSNPRVSGKSDVTTWFHSDVDITCDPSGS